MSKPTNHKRTRAKRAAKTMTCKSYCSFSYLATSCGQKNEDKNKKEPAKHPVRSDYFI